MSDLRTFMNYVIPSVLSFALSGVYAIVDGFFVGNTMGDMGLSAINVAYPITAVILIFNQFGPKQAEKGNEFCQRNTLAFDCFKHHHHSFSGTFP